MVDIFLKEKLASEIKDSEMRQEYQKNKHQYQTEPIVGIITVEFLSYNEAIEIINSCKHNHKNFTQNVESTQKLHVAAACAL